MTNQQYLESLQAEVAGLRKQDSWSNRRTKRIIAIILAIGSVLTCSVCAIFNKLSWNKLYNGFKDDPTSITAEYLRDEEIFDLWNHQANSNDINALLGGGKVYARDGIAVLPATASGYDIIKNGTLIGYILENNISYINVYDGRVIYRDDISRHILCCDETGENKTTLTEHRSGQVIAYGEYVYYINQDDGNSLYCISMADQSIRKIIDDAILNFIVCGDEIFFLNIDNDLLMLSIGSKMPQHIVDNVERFFINGNFIVESGNRLFQLRPSGDVFELILESQSKSFRLVSCSTKAVYYQEAGRLHKLEDGVDTVLNEGNYVYYDSLLESTDGDVYVMAYTDSEGENANSMLLTLSADSR